MHRNLIICISFFFFNTFIYFCLDPQGQHIKIFQITIAALCIIPILLQQSSKQSLPYLLVILVTCIISITSIFINVNKFFMIVPVIFLVGIRGVRKKILLIWQVFTESIWMFISLGVFYEILGSLGHIIFDENLEYFENEFEGMMTIFQISTLDQIGNITRTTYKQQGFILSYSIILFTLIILHTMIFLNMAFICEYISQMNSLRPIQNSSAELVSQKYSFKIRLPKIFNLILSVYMLFYPFQYKINLIYLITTIISFLFINIIQYQKEQSNLIIFFYNIAIEITIIAMYVIDRKQIFFILCLTRIFMIQQVINLLKKVVRSFFSITTLISLNITCFTVLSLVIFILQRNNDQNMKNIFMSFIIALQLLTLDDWTRILRIHSWYTSIVVVVYVLFIKNLLMNAITAEVFSEVARKQNEQNQNQNQIEQQKEEDSIQQNNIEQKSTEQFLDILQKLGYYNKN